MLERRMLILAAALLVLLASAALWNAFVRPTARSSAAATASATPAESVGSSSGPLDSARDTARPVAGVVPPPSPASLAPPVVPSSDAGGPSYIVLLARSEIRRRIRASARITYLNDIVAASSDSALHRWESRVSTPVRLAFAPTTAANFQPAFLDAVRSAFQRWQDAGVPVRFNLDADSSVAEVRVQWRIQFEGAHSGQTDLEWDPDGHLIGGVMSLATFDPKGQPFGADDVHVLALHEIGHLMGLDHSPDPGDIMYPQPKVRDLSPRDISTALLLYDLAPGTLRVGG
jgi:matrixin